MRICKTMLGIVCLLLTGCYSETYDVEEVSGESGKTQVVLTFATPNTSSTRSAEEDPDGYEAGIEWEDYIDISGGDYKIYFFSYSSGDTKGGRLIAEFKTTEITQSSTGSTTTYTMIGDLPSELLNVSDFRVVMLANWGGWYPSVTVGATTIDDLCEGDNTTFNAFKKFAIDQDNLIPFYGVQEYSGVTFAPGETTKLSTPVGLLRAVAKVEVVLSEESDVDGFDNVEIVNYNSQGYNAPWGVYTAEDYNADYSIRPEDDEWQDVFAKDLHLVGGENDSDGKTQTFTQIGGGQDTWRIYVPEYDNMGDDHSYITVRFEDETYDIYFAEYIDGETDNSDTSNRYNLKRNNLYRFYVTVFKEEHFYEITIRVWVDKWENLFENEYTFGNED